MPVGMNERYNKAHKYLRDVGRLPPEYLQEISLTADGEFQVPREYNAAIGKTFDEGGSEKKRIEREEDWKRQGGYDKLGSSYEDATSRLEALVNQHQAELKQKYSAEARRMGPASFLAPEELLREGYLQLARDQAKFSNVGYPQYKGETVSKMSDLTQRARELREESFGKPAPYSRRIENVLNRKKEGFSPENMQAILSILKNGQKNLEEGSLRDLSKQFQATSTPYSARADRFKRKSSEDLGRTEREATGALEDIGKRMAITEGGRNLQIAKSLQGLQAQRQDKQERLIGNLEQFGNQKHGYNNIASDIAKRQFDEEALAPQKRMEMLQELLDSKRGSIGDGAHPDVEQASGREIAQGLRAYGLDPSQQVEQWDSNRRPQSSYKGQLVADLPSEITGSYDILTRLDPRMKDEYSSQRKGLVKGLVESEGLTEQTLKELPAALRGPIEQLEYDAQRQRKKDLAKIGNKYIKYGAFDSTSHRRDAEDRVREINKEALEQRERLIRGTLAAQYGLKHDQDANNISKLDTLGATSQKNRLNLFGDIRKLNDLGATKWENDQNENEEIYKNYQNQGMWEWPHMRNRVRREAQGEIFQGLANRNIGLDQVANLNTRYSETERERDDLRRQLDMLQAARSSSSSQPATAAGAPALSTMQGARSALASQAATAASAPSAAEERRQKDAAAAASAEQERARLQGLSTMSYHQLGSSYPEFEKTKTTWEQAKAALDAYQRKAPAKDPNGQWSLLPGENQASYLARIRAWGAQAEALKKTEREASQAYGRVGGRPLASPAPAVASAPSTSPAPLPAGSAGLGALAQPAGTPSSARFLAHLKQKHAR